MFYDDLTCGSTSSTSPAARPRRTGSSTPPTCSSSSGSPTAATTCRPRSAAGCARRRRSPSPSSGRSSCCSSTSRSSGSTDRARRAARAVRPSARDGAALARRHPRARHGRRRGRARRRPARRRGRLRRPGQRRRRRRPRRRLTRRAAPRPEPVTAVTIAAMYEFDSVSVSSYEAASLAAKLTEKSADGWDVVAIVPAGHVSTSAAFLGHGARPPTGRRRRSPTAPQHDPAPSRPPTPPPSWDADVGQQRAGGGPRTDLAHVDPGDATPGGTGRAPATTSTAPLGHRGGTSSADSRGGSAQQAATARHAIGAGRLVRRPGRSLRAALLGRLGVDRARLARRPAVHRSARRLTRNAAGSSSARGDRRGR